jgi:hypothetical protein
LRGSNDARGGLTNLLPSSGRKEGQKLFFPTKIVTKERSGASGNANS